MTQQAEKHTFQADVNQVLSLVVNSLYTHREVFLRELVSNASDALDHLSFRVLTEPEVMGDQTELKIDVVPDSDARTLTITDTGVGMTREELVENLGTIAHSGSKSLVESMSGDTGKDLSLIGQFGVGFYSAFLVAEQVEVVSRAAGAEQAWRWTSAADGTFTVEEVERDARGTDVVLHLRKDEEMDDFLREWSLRELVCKYSDYVRHPIRLRVQREKPTDPEDDGSETETVIEWEQVNRGAALWTRSKSDVTDEQVNEFYKHLTHDWEPPISHTHFKVEGMHELAGMLFIPTRQPPDLMARQRRGIRLFVKRVFIMDDCEELLPEWMRFVRGVVDSEDLPLNVSREFLQKDKTTAAIRKQVVRHVFKMLEEMAGEDAAPAAEDASEEDAAEGTEEEPKKEGGERRYDTFWKAFGHVLKEGMHFDAAHRDQLSKLLRFDSSADEGLTSLTQYVERMPEGQTDIYYLNAASRAAAASSPHLESLRKHGFEVLYMTDPVDEWIVTSFTEFEDKKLVSAAKGALELPESDEEKEQREEQSNAVEPLIEKMKGVLVNDVSEVRATSRLTDSPACLVADASGISPHIERLLRAQQQDMPDQKRILEINPSHPVIERLLGFAASDDEGERVEEWTKLLYDQALIAEGSPPSDPAGFARRITGLLQQAAG